MSNANPNAGLTNGQGIDKGSGRLSDRNLVRDKIYAIPLAV
jgi:hypothetical protein